MTALATDRPTMQVVPMAWQTARIESKTITEDGVSITLFRFTQPHRHAGRLCTWGARVITPQTKSDAWIAETSLEALHDEIRDHLESELLYRRRPADSWRHTMH